MALSTVFMVLGFGLAAYSIVANDAIQTLGTFLSSNSKRPWWQLWLFVGGILAAVLTYGWFASEGDVSYGRLEDIPHPEITWVFLLPPLAVLALTLLRAPVSTTFLVLTVFSPRSLGPMLLKSLLGYAVAFVVGIVVYKVLSKRFERRLLGEKVPSTSRIWTLLQWASTGFLWSQWLIQDLANIFVYLPRSLPPMYLALSLIGMLGMLALIFAQRGGGIQHIVTDKTNTQDIRSATLIDFVYGLILLLFKEVSNVPMSTTWVFIGLLGGRELMMTWELKHKTSKVTGKVIAKDVGRAGLGLAVSVGIAFLIPWLNRFA